MFRAVALFVLVLSSVSVYGSDSELVNSVKDDLRAYRDFTNMNRLDSVIKYIRTHPFFSMGRSSNA